jgi:glycosyltransferase involved in cell wall biosynthesis
MNILVFSTDDHLHPAGGAESAMGEIAQRLPEIQFDLVCAKLRKSAKRYEEIGNMRIHRLGFGIPKIDGVLLALFGHIIGAKLYKEYRHDIIWSIMASYGAFSARRMKEKYNIPFLLTLQEGDSIEYVLHKVRFVRGQFNSIFQNADALQPISHFLKKWGIEMGFKGEQSAVIPNGVDISKFMKKFSDETIRATRESFGFAENAKIVITSSRLEKKNGIGDVIDALTLLPQEVSLVVCGDGSLREELEQKVEELSLRSRVRFLGYLPLDDIPKYLKSSDIFIRPSLTEGLGTAFLEAMAAQLPTIGTPVGGIPDFLDDGVTGFMCMPEDSQSVANALKRALSLTESEKEKLTSTAKQMVLDTYDWDNIASQMRELFNALKKA